MATGSQEKEGVKEKKSEKIKLNEWVVEDLICIIGLYIFFLNIVLFSMVNFFYGILYYFQVWERIEVWHENNLKKKKKKKILLQRLLFIWVKFWCSICSWFFGKSLVHISNKRLFQFVVHSNSSGSTFDAWFESAYDTV